MTSKRRKFAIAALFCIGVVVVIVFLNHESEPRYGGKTLSQWLAANPIYGKSKEAEEAMLAVRTIGTNALPNLLSWIQYEEPAWKASLKGVVPSRIWGNNSFQHFIAGRAGRRAEYGMMGFEILGTNAIAVLPQLETLSKSTNAPATALRAFAGLVCIGEPSIPALERALADTNQIYRIYFPAWLRNMAERDDSTAYLPLIRQALTNDDLLVRANAARVLKAMETPSE